MLNATNLKAFLEAAKSAIPAIGNTIPVVSDNDVGDFSRDLKASDTQVTIIGVLPSIGLDFKDKDNYRHSNKLLLFLVRKHDIRSGNDAFLSVYDQAAAAVLALEDFMFLESQKFPCNPIFKEINFPTFAADPVRDYFGLNGYMITLELYTK